MSEDIRNRIADYLSAHHTITLATCVDKRPWATSVFYCHDEDLNIYFLSDPKTLHCQQIEANSHVALTINEDVCKWSDIQGLQIDGTAERVAENDHKTAQKIFLRKFIDLKAMFDAALSGDAKAIAERFQKTPFYRVKPNWIRFIDNSRGFGFKEELKLD